MLKSYEIWDHQGVLLEEVSSALPQPFPHSGSSLHTRAHTRTDAHSLSHTHTHTHTHTHMQDGYIVEGRTVRSDSHWNLNGLGKLFLSA